MSSGIQPGRERAFRACAAGSSSGRPSLSSPNTKQIFDEAHVCGLIIRWQQSAPGPDRDRLWAQIATACQGMLKGIVATHSRKIDTTGLGTIQEIVSELTLKLHKILPHFRPDRGRAFSFITLCVTNHLRTLTDKQSRRSFRHISLPPEEFELMPSLNTASALSAELREVLDHFCRLDVDYDAFLTRNLCTYYYLHVREGQGDTGEVVAKRIAAVVQRVCRISEERALEKTETALSLLRSHLAPFRGRGCLPKTQQQQPPNSHALSCERNESKISTVQGINPLEPIKSPCVRALTSAA